MAKQKVSRHVSLAILFTINLLNYMDRTIISGVLGITDPDKAGFIADLTFVQGGLLQTAFVVVFMLLAPLFGYIGDRYNRTNQIVIGVLLWATATLLSSFCQVYWQLLLCRALVGIGEASYATISPTIIADLYAGTERVTALAVFYIGIPLGGALGYCGGIVGAAFGWQWAFRITPPLCLLAAILAFVFLRDPNRGAADGTSTINANMGLRAFLEDALECVKVKSFTFSTLAMTCSTFAVGAVSLWMPRFVVEITLGTPQETSISMASLIFGGITAVNGIVATMSGAYIANLLGKRTGRADALVCAVGLVLTTPCFCGCLLIFGLQAYVGWAFAFFSIYGMCVNWALSPAILLATVTPERRGVANALQILCTHLFGDALSPYIIGAVSDAMVASGTSKGKALGTALQICVGVVALGAVLFFLTATHYIADKKKIEDYIHSLENTSSNGTAQIVGSMADPERKEKIPI